MGWYEDLLNLSYYGAYKNASREREWLHEPNNEWYAANDNDSALKYDEMLKGQQQEAVAGGIVTGLTGATTLLSNAFKDSQIRDTSMQEGIISDLYNAGNYNYNNYEQLANDYARTDFNPDFNYHDIRGMTTGQQIGSVATSALSGAATGLQIGGPWGALIGGVVGLGTGLGGVFAGNSAAHIKQDSLNLQAELASDAAQQNFAAAHERIGDSMHRQNAVNAVKYGGPIKTQSIQEFADRVLRKPSNRYPSGRIPTVKREYCNGGLKVRIKR